MEHDILIPQPQADKMCIRDRYDTKMDGNGWLEVSSDGSPLCRIKYNGQFLSNADKNLSDEYRSKIADIQDEICLLYTSELCIPKSWSY